MIQLAEYVTFVTSHFMQKNLTKYVIAVGLTEQEIFDFKLLAHLRGQSDRKCISSIIRRELDLRRDQIEKIKRVITPEEVEELAGYGKSPGRPNKRNVPKPLGPLLQLCLEDEENG